MDDILLAYIQRPDWDYERFCKDFASSTCYVPPLKLEDGRQDTFLETTFNVQGNTIRYKLKNDNSGGLNKVWRYQHFWSHTAYIQKRAVLTGCLKKVQRMASDRGMLYESATEKLAEFTKLCYPKHMLRAACTYMAATQNERIWLDVRDYAL